MKKFIETIINRKHNGMGSAVRMGFHTIQVVLVDIFPQNWIEPFILFSSTHSTSSSSRIDRDNIIFLKKKELPNAT